MSLRSHQTLRIYSRLALAVVLSCMDCYAHTDQATSRSGRETIADGVSAVDFEFSASSVACERHRIILRSNGTATMFTELCRESGQKEIAMSCQVKEGEICKPLKGSYTRSITDGVYQSTRVIRKGKRYEVVNYADAGPFNLWPIQEVVEGVASMADWNKTEEQPTCPEWDAK